MRKDWDTLALCDRFFDAIEQKDFATLESCYAPEAIVWHSHDCLYQSRESNLETLQDGMTRFKKMRYREPPHPRLRGRLRAAAHALRHARRTTSSARWTCASSATRATA